MAHGERILAFIRDHPGTTTPEIADAMKIQCGKAYCYAKKLEPYGLVRHETVFTGGRNGRLTYWWPKEVV